MITWRRRVQKDEVAGLSRKPGRKADAEAGLARKIAQLERANRRLSEKLGQAEFVIEFQKKMADLWAIPTSEEKEETE